MSKVQLVELLEHCQPLLIPQEKVLGAIVFIKLMQISVLSIFFERLLHKYGYEIQGSVRKSLFLVHMTELIKLGLFLLAIMFIDNQVLVMMIIGISTAIRNWLQFGMLTYILFRMKCVMIFLGVTNETEYPDVALA